MEKIVVVFTAPEPVREDCRRYIDRLGTVLAPQVDALTVHIASGPMRSDFLGGSRTDGKPDGPDIYDGRIYCGLSMWIDTIERAEGLYASLDFMPGDRSLYSVVESAPREYEHIGWTLGEPSPGATLFALFRKKPGLTVAQFAERWVEHSALSLRIHALSRYHRNFVVRRIVGTGEDWDGIVEERVGSVEDLDPERFYLGGPEVRAIAVADIAAFIDVHNGMRCNMLQEFILKLPSWLEPQSSAASR